MLKTKYLLSFVNHFSIVDLHIKKELETIVIMDYEKCFFSINYTLNIKLQK